MKQLWKRNAVVGTILVFVCAAIFLNGKYAEKVDKPTKVLGQSELVSTDGDAAEVKDGEIIVDVYLMVRYGYAIPDTARKVQDSVSAAVSGMTGYNVHAVNVHVGGISFN